MDKWGKALFYKIKNIKLKKRFINYSWFVIPLDINPKMLASKSGVYVIRVIDSINKPIYVGSTKDISFRLGGHSVLKNIKKNTYLYNDIEFLFLPTKNVWEAHRKEREIIYKTKPYLNIRVSNKLVYGQVKRVAHIDKDKLFESMVTTLSKK